MLVTDSTNCLIGTASGLTALKPATANAPLARNMASTPTRINQFVADE
jgi:hypothetical protein